MVRPGFFSAEPPDEPQIQRELTGLVALVGSIHQQMDGFAGASQVFK